MKIIHIATALALGMAPGLAFAVPTCPPVGDATAGCDITIVVSSGGVTIAPGPSAGIAGGTYDGAEDTLIGIENDTNAPLSSIDLSSTLDIMGFDGDGIDTFGVPGNSLDNSAANIAAGIDGYGGPNTYFTNINAAHTAGTANFVTPLAANGGTTYFGLEEALQPSNIVVGPAVPEPSSFILLGTGLAGVAGAIRRKFAR